jgi:hypothetical protein
LGEDAEKSRHLEKKRKWNIESQAQLLPFALNSSDVLDKRQVIFVV